MKKDKIIFTVSILSMIILIFSGCVPFISPEPEENSFSEEFVLVQVTDSESNLIFVTGKENEDAMAILGDKNTEGNPIGITGAVYVSEQGDSFAIEAGIDGLPTYLIDSEGNTVIFENYTNSTVDISIYDSSGSLIQDTTTINLDPADLLELKQLYNSFYSKQRWSNENTEFALKWGAVGLSAVGCGLALYGTVQTGGALALTPAVGWACGKASLSVIAAVTPNDTDNLISMGVGTGSCLISGGADVWGCESTILSIVAWGNEQSISTTPPQTLNENVVSNVGATAVTYYQSKSNGINHKIYIGWSTYGGASGYRVYRSVGGESDYVLMFDSKYGYYNSYGWHNYSWDDLDVVQGSAYSYYVTAYGNDWETAPSEKVSIKTFLPPCSLISPEDGTVILDSNNSFTWSPVGLSNFYAYDPITSGKTEIWVYNKVNGKTVWQIWLDGFTISNVVYNQDGNASPLVPGDSYIWSSWSWGYDEYGHSIAVSMGESWGFHYLMDEQ